MFIKKMRDAWRQIFRGWARNQVKVVKSWLIYENFERDMGTVIGNEVLIRKSTKRPFGPGNCYWGTRAEQNRLRTGKFLRFQRQSKTIAEWARDFGMARSTLRGYIKRYGPTSGLRKAFKTKLVPDEGLIQSNRTPWTP
jgi:hypothetical protein